MIRTSSDVSGLETEIAEPENYPVIRDALKRRSKRIADVVIVQRPSMIPNRGNRRTPSRSG